MVGVGSIIGCEHAAFSSGGFADRDDLMAMFDFYEYDEGRKS